MKAAIFPAIVIAALLMRCSPQLTGGTLDTGNAKVAAVIHAHDGSRAARAWVVVCPAGFLPGIGPDSASSRNLFVKRLSTDDTGYFRIDSIDTGTYNIEVNDGGSSATLLRITVPSSDTSTIALDDTLRPYAAIRGNAGSAFDASKRRYLLIYGLDRQITLGDDGAFYLSDLPAGTFRLRVVTEGNAAEPVELDGVSARPSETVSVPFMGWGFRAPIALNTTADGAGSTGNVYGFPVLVRLSHNNFHFNEAKGDGSDCRFAKSDDTPLAFEVEQWDSLGEQAALWVRVDTVLGNNAGQTIFLLWGNPGAAAVDNSGGVFDTANGFMDVYHFNGSLNDATANGYNGIDNNSIDTNSGIIGNGRAFNGQSQYFHAGDLPDRPSGTISCWFRPKATIDASVGKTQGIWGKKTTDSLDFTLSLRGAEFYPGPGGEGSGVAGTIMSKLENPDTAYYLASATSVFSKDVWYFASWTWGNGGNFIYVNGAMEGSDPRSLAVSGEANDEIGRSLYDASNILGGGPLYFSGTFDEFRIDQVTRSADWIKLCYMNQRQDDKLVVVGGQ